MNLPQENNLSINLLSSIFNKTSATYKFYWFLAIIESVEEGKIEIDKKDLFIKMISNSWYSVNYFNLSFGIQDLIQDSINKLTIIENLKIDESKESIEKLLSSSENNLTKNILNHFDKNVPHWFLSPWYPNTSKNEVYSLSLERVNNPIYSLSKEKIFVNEIWVEYLLKNAKILKDFIFWNLALYLQKRNPNVPDIPNKLIKPAIRESLTKQRKFWDFVLEYEDDIKCIYTGDKIEIGNYDVEHFIPYSFVSHNQIWNLIPSQKAFNIRKSNKLPKMEEYFEAFYQLQKKAIDVYNTEKPKEKLLFDYYNIGFDVSRNFDKKKFYNTVNPLVNIASNNGFQFL